MIGVASANADYHTILVSGIAGLVAGAMSMAAGEYVSVSSQSDSEAADLARERRELRDAPEHEVHELAGIYESRGVDRRLARQVAEQLTARDALAAHAHDELGISGATAARPVEAALTSAAAFAVGAALPLLTALIVSGGNLAPAIGMVSLVALAVLGAIGAKAGGAPMRQAAIRVTFWGALAMAVTAGIGTLFGAHV
jgi:VIT1/CCC1 family predicted Fe2+/Mn2+ transporter